MRVSTGSETIDRKLSELIAAFESVFPSRIRGYFLEGSYADQSALATSDIDLILVFKNSFMHEDEQRRAEQLASLWEKRDQCEFDIGFHEEEKLATGVPPTLKLGSILLYGEPLPDAFPLISVLEWGRERTHAAYWLMNKAFNRPTVVTYPLDYPNSTAEFYGYTERKVRLANGQEVPSTRNLIRVMGWAGTALVALQGKQVVPRKSDCHRLYRQSVNDQWAPFLEELYERCRSEWRYLIPTSEQDRAALRAICQRALDFENHFLQIYKQFLLAELTAADEVRRARTHWVLEKLPFQEPQILAMLSEVTDCKAEDAIES